MLGLSLIVHSTSSAQQIKADMGSVAIGGSVTNSTINIGVTSEQLVALVKQGNDLSETQKKLITNLEQQLDINQRQIRAALDVLGEKNVEPERLAAKLVEIAERFKSLQASTSFQPGDDPEVSRLKSAAREAIDAGDLPKADESLADAEAKQEGDLSRQALDLASTVAQRGDIALT